jgi:peptidoglycan/xylan/chitin deacetylase (PgdA/CDA1 family)
MNDGPRSRVRSIEVRTRTPSLLVAGLLVAVAVVLGVTPPMPAVAGGWPQPAAGISASGGPELIFSFDDGPSPATTGKVLDILAAHKIKAVFFVVGWRFQRGEIARTTALVGRILREGHVIGNHSISHHQFCQMTPERLDTEIGGARTLLERIAGMPVPWFRVPYGSRCIVVEEALARHGYDHFHWDIDPQEWQGRSAKATAAVVIRQLARLDRRAVLLMHDTKVATAFALPEILGWIETENARREKIGRPAIKIVSAPELAAEHVRPTIEWLDAAVTAGRDRLDRVLTETIP